MNRIEHRLVPLRQLLDEAAQARLAARSQKSEPRLAERVRQALSLRPQPAGRAPHAPPPTKPRRACPPGLLDSRAPRRPSAARLTAGRREDWT